MMRGYYPLLLLALLLAPSLAKASPCESPDMLTRVSGRNECLIIRSFDNQKGTAEPPVLYVMLHGNHSDGSPATSMFKPAQTLVEKANRPSVAVALVRPGYNDDLGDYSTGNRNRADNWPTDVIDDIADAIRRLKEHHKARRVVLVGHSGGSAVAGVILGRHPNLADAALLVGCVCDLRQWRAGRAGGLWTSASPGDYVGRIPPGTKISVLVGAGDSVTSPSLSEGYVADLTDHGFKVDFKLQEGRDHYNIIRWDGMYDMILRLGEE
jgi:pimeloyl-ACP methyl ester carboxylesterase